MRFLLKTVFWLTLAFVVLPHTPLAGLKAEMDQWVSAEPIGNPATEPDKTAEKAIQTLSTAKEKLADLTTFCEKNPLLCETGKSAISNAIQNLGNEAAKTADGGVPVPTLREAAEKAGHN
ncbi:hypothetical protein GCM10011491_41010 [Brucella endophytica]|uniref:Uncharacterized protein n=1 Tax=Brucella endophytica TaxID=1963359 RepID=A0A916WK20_9HYPH|nr:DUF5330 domain-containing protein [Brucella endophytica]GGB08806.1 hypothetical protein GCM10011491_41010 [Brucella endophytica]